MEDMEAPKDLVNIFISPNLNKESNYKRASNEKSDKESSINLEDLLRSNDNILFIGREEVGKTTLLHYITNYYLNHYSIDFDVPFYIDFFDFPPGKKPLEKQMIKFATDYFESENTPNMLGIE